MSGRDLKTAFLFPGGGSQKVGMGESLAASCDECRATIAEADRVLGYPLSRVMFQGPKEELDPSVTSHPAILTVSVMQAHHLAEQGLTADMAVGHSLGQYSALVAAGALAFDAAVRLVTERARLMQQAVPVGTGAMVAVVGLDRDEIYDACRQARSVGIVNVACHNSPAQTVISGERPAVERAAGICEEAGGGVVLLPISVASHCDLLIPIREPMTELIETTAWTDPAIPVIDNVSARPLTTAGEVRHALITQLTSSVLFQEILQYVAGQGIGQLVECGPGKSLIELARRVIPDVELLDFDAALRSVAMA